MMTTTRTNHSRKKRIVALLALAMAALLVVLSALAAPDAQAKKKRHKARTAIVTLTRTFSSPTLIATPDAGPASPYPSHLFDVAGFVGPVEDVNVKLNGFDHEFPDDVDVMLVGPQGQNAIVMSDVGGNKAVTGVDLTLDDEAASPLPDGAPIVGGSFKPTDYDPTGAFPSPAPTPSGSSNLSVFDGTNPNGTWELYVLDDAGGQSGQFARGWSLEITGKVAIPGKKHKRHRH